MWPTYKVNSVPMCVFLIMSGFHEILILIFYIGNKKKVVIGENNSQLWTNEHPKPEYQHPLQY